MPTTTVLTERELRDLFARADAAGVAAAGARVPVPMVVEAHANPFDDASPVVTRYAPVLGGVCGFAWVTIHPGNSRAANFAKRHLAWRTAYGGGVQKWISAYGQSMELKEAYAEGYAAVLRAAGLKAYAGSRMD